MAEHTPTPWQDTEDPRGRLIHVETACDNPHGAGHPVCSIPVKRKADAAFICAACNAYGAMRKLQIELDNYADITDDGGPNHAMRMQLLLDEYLGAS